MDGKMEWNAINTKLAMPELSFNERLRSPMISPPRQSIVNELITGTSFHPSSLSLHPFSQLGAHILTNNIQNPKCNVKPRTKNLKNSRDVLRTSSTGMTGMFVVPCGRTCAARPYGFHNNFPCSPLTSSTCARLKVERPSDKSG